MKKLINYLPFHFLIGLILGIILQYNYTIWQFGFAKLFGVSAFLILVSFLFHRFSKPNLFGFSTFIFFVFVGVSSVFIQNSKNYNTYYENFVDENSTAIVVIDKVLKSGKFNNKYEANVTQINTQKTIGRVLINIKKDSLHLPLQVGNQLFLKPVFLRCASAFKST